MGLNKVTYVDNTTVIRAANLNAIQDEIIANAEDIEDNTEAIETKQADMSLSIVDGAINITYTE